MNHLKAIASLIGLLLLLPACKPTENNYKAAYDIAQAKRQKEATDPDIIIPGGKLAGDDAPQQIVIDSIPVLYRCEHLKLIDGVGPLPKYNIVIATYKMTANARAHWEELVKTVPGARLLQNPSGIYLISIASADKKEDAARLIRDYTGAHPDIHYVGISEQRPLLYEAAGHRAI